MYRIGRQIRRNVTKYLWDIHVLIKWNNSSLYSQTYNFAHILTFVDFCIINLVGFFIFTDKVEFRIGYIFDI